MKITRITSHKMSIGTPSDSSSSGSGATLNNATTNESDVDSQYVSYLRSNFNVPDWMEVTE